jgi:hypothetical protein
MEFKEFNKENGYIILDEDREETDYAIMKYSTGINCITCGVDTTSTGERVCSKCLGNVLKKVGDGV